METSRSGAMGLGMWHGALTWSSNLMSDRFGRLTGVCVDPVLMDGLQLRASRPWCRCRWTTALGA